MPTIPRLKDKKRPPTARAKERHKAYSNTQWKQLRSWYFMCHPLCECCQDPECVNEDGSFGTRVTAAKDVHHLASPFSPNISEAEKQRRLLDYNNLKSVCRWHHNYLHGNVKPPEKN